MGTEFAIPNIEWVKAERDLAIKSFSIPSCFVIKETQDIHNGDDKHNGNHDEERIKES
ncbi:MAG: hypothetical protein PHR56_06135 [Dehalococcoidales bacterium]|nr:hypothetical protein [Dehalococcoidales bacterium]